MMVGLSPFIPYLIIATGCLLAFAGNKFVYLVFSAGILVVASILFMMIMFNFMKQEDAGTVILPFSCVSAMGLAAWVTWYSYRNLQRYMMTFIGGCIGQFIGLLIAYHFDF